MMSLGIYQSCTKHLLKLDSSASRVKNNLSFRDMDDVDGALLTLQTAQSNSVSRETKVDFFVPFPPVGI